MEGRDFPYILCPNNLPDYQHHPPKRHICYNSWTYTNESELTFKFTQYWWHILNLWRWYFHSLYEYILKLGKYFDAHVDKIGLGFQESIFWFVLFSFWLCCKACRTLVLRSGIKPVCLALKVQCLKHWTAREVEQSVLYLMDFYILPIIKFFNMK